MLAILVVIMVLAIVYWPAAKVYRSAFGNESGSHPYRDAVAQKTTATRHGIIIRPKPHQCETPKIFSSGGDGIPEGTPEASLGDVWRCATCDKVWVIAEYYGKCFWREGKIRDWTNAGGQK